MSCYLKAQPFAGPLICIAILVAYIPPVCYSVKGCSTFLIKDLKHKKSVCTNHNSRFATIPPELPKEVAELEISNQLITTLNSSSFKHLPQLRLLILDSNKISFISEDTFKLTTQLKSLSLKNNSLLLGPMSLTKKALNYLSGLHELYLNYNPIGIIPDEFFGPLKNLRKLILTGAVRGLKLKPRAFDGLNYLEHLDLSSNQLTTLPEEMRSTLNMMQLKSFFLFFNPWTCDCHLRWLIVWFIDHNNAKYSDRRQRRANVIEAEPMCYNPPQFRNRVILSQAPNPLQLPDYQCKPIIFSEDAHLKVEEGSNLTLSCHFRADPPEKVEWFKDITRVQQDLTGRITITQTQGTDFKAILSVRNVQMKDEGKWQCFLLTTAGRANSTFTLKVLPAKTSKYDTTRFIIYMSIGTSGLILLIIAIGTTMYCFSSSIYCCYLRNLERNYSQGKRRQQTPQSSAAREQVGTANRGYHHSVNNNIHINETTVPEEIVINSEMTPRKRLMLARAGGNVDMMHHEVMPLTASLQVDGATGLEAVVTQEGDLALLQCIDPATCGRSLGRATSSVNPGYMTQHATAVPDNCPVHGGIPTNLRSTYSPCPIHGDTISRSQTPQIPATTIIPKPSYGTLPTGSNSASSANYKPCPLHGDLLATMQKRVLSPSSGAGPQTSTGTSTLPLSTAVPTKGILRPRSPPKPPRRSSQPSVEISTTSTIANTDLTGAVSVSAASSTFVRASQVDDCITTDSAAACSSTQRCPVEVNTSATGEATASTGEAMVADTTAVDTGNLSSGHLPGGSSSEPSVHNRGDRDPVASGPDPNRLEDKINQNTVIQKSQDDEGYSTAV